MSAAAVEQLDGSGAGLTEPIPVSVKTRDPISEFGVLAQLRFRPEVVIAGADVRPGRAGRDPG